MFVLNFIKQQKDEVVVCFNENNNNNRQLTYLLNSLSLGLGIWYLIYGLKDINVKEN